MVLMVVGMLAGPPVLRAMCAMLTSIQCSCCWWVDPISIMATLMPLISTACGKRVVVRVVLKIFLLLISSYVEFLVLKKVSQYSVRVRVDEFLHTLIYCTVACKNGIAEYKKNMLLLSSLH